MGKCIELFSRALVILTDCFFGHLMPPVQMNTQAALIAVAQVLLYVACFLAPAAMQARSWFEKLCCKGSLISSFYSSVS